MTSVTVTHLPTGESFTVPGEAARPAHRVRLALALAGRPVTPEGWTPCEVTGVLLAAGPRAELRDGARLASVAADRVVNDHPDFRVTTPDGRPARVAYSRRTVVAVDPVVNGSGERDAHRDALARAALARLRGE